MKRVVIVQARFTSTRLPGKVIMDLNGRSVLRHVLERCALISGVSVVCCAVPEGAVHDAVAAEASAAGAAVVRGPEQDVLARTALAAEATQADVVMRVTSDCPVIDPDVCGLVFSALQDGVVADYAANNFVRRFPHGLDCEAFTRAALERAAAEATEPYDREHVTPWLRRVPSIRRVSVEGPSDHLGRLRWTLDFAEDLAFFRALLAEPGTDGASWTDLVATVQGKPSLTALNAMRASS